MDILEQKFKLAQKYYNKRDYVQSIEIYMNCLNYKIEDGLCNDYTNNLLEVYDNLISFIYKFFNNLKDISNDNIPNKCLSLLGISQCLNNVTARNFNPRNMNDIINCLNAQRLTLLIYRESIDLMKKLDLKVGIDCLNALNYRLIVFELNLGSLYSIIPDKNRRKIADELFVRCLKRSELLLSKNFSRKFLVLKSICYKKLGKIDDYDKTLNKVSNYMTEKEQQREIDLLYNKLKQSKHCVHFYGEQCV